MSDMLEHTTVSLVSLALYAQNIGILVMGEKEEAVREITTSSKSKICVRS